MYDMVIIGAGTAGLSAAIYGVRAGKSVLVLEGESYGGQIINSPEVENYPGIAKISGFEFATGLYEQAKNLGASIEFEAVSRVEKTGKDFIVYTEEREIPCHSVILATGAKNRPLGVEREVELVGAGVSYCATCDGAFFRGQETAVVGGGSTALEDAEFLSSYCSKVYLIHRRDEFRGEQWLVENLRKKENVEFVLDSRVTEILGEQGVEGILVENVKTGDIRELKISGLFVAIGQMPDNSSFAPLVDLDAGGYIKALEDCKTSEAGIFAAGDCRTKTVRQLTTAASDGAVAGLAACEYINRNE
ncbi:MAG: thioredoxin-disulfide reductase [Clostridia bacterium]|nr:thioredoxin-disulfide reductase [Lachnospiraceae bacterium]NCC00247.1 thioredoxin-disulfide reductase [Clostridia bacterium]NCD02271.1 thioredoxin-disulfide reductase [Clostridia bacterium]